MRTLLWPDPSDILGLNRQVASRLCPRMGVWRFSVQRTRKGSVVHRDGHETYALGYRATRGDFLHRSHWLRCSRGDQLGFDLQERVFRQKLKRTTEVESTIPSIPKTVSQSTVASLCVPTCRSVLFREPIERGHSLHADPVE